MKHLKQSFVGAGLVSTLLFTSCADDPNIRSAQTRGAATGTGLGAIIGNNVAGIGSGEAMIIGAILGAMGGEKSVTNPRQPHVIRTVEPGRTYR